MKKLFVLLIFVTINSVEAGLIFSFSFNNDSGNAAGPIVGEIRGLLDNMAGQQAIELMIQDTGTHSGGLLAPPEFDLISVPGSTVHVNSFDVSGGVITNFGFSWTNPTSPDNRFEIGFVAIHAGANTSLWANGGNFTLQSSNPTVDPGFESVVPEPSTYALILTGLIGLGVIRKNRMTVK